MANGERAAAGCSAWPCPPLNCALPACDCGRSPTPTRQSLYALYSSADVLRYWDAPPWTGPGRAQTFIATCRTIEEEGTGARVAVDRVCDGAFIGWCGLTTWNPDFRSASLGYVFDAAA